MELEIMFSSGGDIEALPTFHHEPHRAWIRISPAGPDLVIEKDGRPLKKAPAAFKKHADFIAIDCNKAVRKFTDMGWSAGRVDYPFFHKAYPSHGVRATLLPGNRIESLSHGEDFVTDTLSFSPSESDYFDHFSPLPLDETPAVVFSEAIRDLASVFPK